MVYWETAPTIQINRSSCSSGRGSGRRPTRLFTRGPWPGVAPGRALSGSSTPTRSGGSKTTVDVPELAARR
jgi:hypothetical protein